MFSTGANVKGNVALALELKKKKRRNEHWLRQNNPFSAINRSHLSSIHVYIVFGSTCLSFLINHEHIYAKIVADLMYTLHSPKKELNLPLSQGCLK